MATERTTDAALVLWEILERFGPGPKTGLSGQMAHVLQRAVSPRDFADALHHARRVLSAERGKPIVYSHTLDAYGFPGDLASTETHILRFNGSYLATRAETFLVQAEAAEQMHGPSPLLTQFQHVDGAFAFAMRALVDQYRAGVLAESAGRRTGVDATVRLENGAE